MWTIAPVISMAGPGTTATRSEQRTQERDIAVAAEQAAARTSSFIILPFFRSLPAGRRGARLMRTHQRPFGKGARAPVAEISERPAPFAVSPDFNGVR